MVIRSTDPVAHAPREEETVRRVEREAEAQEFGHKDRSAGRERRSPHNKPGSSPQDSVDVSEQYLSAQESAPLPSPPPSSSPENAPEMPGHRLDMEA